LNLLETVRHLKTLQATVWVSGQRKLVIDFSEADVPDELMDALRAHREDLVRLYEHTAPDYIPPAPKPAGRATTPPPAHWQTQTPPPNPGTVESVPYRWWAPGDRLPGQTIAIDTETEALGTINDPGAQAPRMVVGTATDGQAGYYLLPDTVGPFLNAHTEAKFVFHNVGFDAFVIERALSERQAGSFWTLVDTDRVGCTLELERLLSLATVGVAETYPSLDALTRKYLGRATVKDAVDSDGDEIRTSFGKYIGRPHTDIPQVALDYASGDTTATLAVWNAQQRALDDVRAAAANAYGFPGADELEQAWQTYGPLTLHTQVKAAIVARVMGMNGICFDSSRRDEIINTLKADQADAAKRLRSLGIPVPVDPEAEAGTVPQWEIDTLPKDVPAVRTSMIRHLEQVEGTLLESGALTEPFKRTASGRICMDREQRAEWLAIGLDETISAFAAWEQARKFRATYAEKMVADRVHPKWNHLLNSGRFSCTGALALQTLPKCGPIDKERPRLTLRQCITPGEGRVFVAVDFSQIELVALAAAMQFQTKYGQALADVIRAGQDVHASIAALMFGDRIGPVSKVERTAVKPISFGRPGGMGPETIQRVAKLVYGLSLELAEVQRIIDAYHQLAPELDRHLEKTVDPGTRASQFLGLNSKAEGWKILNVLSGKSLVSPDAAARAWGLAQRFKPILQGNKKTRAMLADAIEKTEPSDGLARAVRNALTEESSLTMTGRLRARCSFQAARNNVFQGLAADGGILALWSLFRQGYQITMFVHDELVVSVPDNGKGHLHAEVVARTMQDEMSKVLAGMPVGAESFVSGSFSKHDRLKPGEVCNRHHTPGSDTQATPRASVAVTVKGPTPRRKPTHERHRAPTPKPPNGADDGWMPDDLPF